MLALRLLLGLKTVGAIVTSKPPLVASPGAAGAGGSEFDAAPAIQKNFMCYDSAEEALLTEPPPETKLAMVVHRKTGFVLAGSVAHCWNHSEVVRLDRVSVVKRDVGVPVVHITRGPIDFVVSNYLYNLVSSHEPGTLGPGTAGHHMKKCRKWNAKVADALPHPYVDETLREYLERLPENRSLAFTMCESMSYLNRMVEVSLWCGQKESCLELQLEDFMESSPSYWESWRKIMSLGGLQYTYELRECLKRQDMHSRYFKREDHCSSHAVSSDERGRLKVLAAELDWRVFDGIYANATAGKEPKKVK